MSDPRRPEWLDAPQPGYGPNDAQGYQSPPYTDPAYADEAPYASTYAGSAPHWAPNPNENPTLQLPPYWQQEQAPSGEVPDDGHQPPDGPKSPRWLWFVAGAALLLVVGLVIALALANGANKTQTAVPPLPGMPESSPTTPSRSTGPTRTHSPRPAPVPPTSGTPTETTEPGAMESVVYNVTGDGRAISIMYIDTGDVIQTEFNVSLPWNKEVSLSKSALHPASVTIVNIGHNVTCSVTIDGVQVRERVGVGLTFCNAPPS
jgi:hypothetical protein